jgi:ribosomal protein S27AE
MGLIAAGLILIFALFMIIPVIGWIIGILGIIAVIICYPLFSGLVRAGFYEEIKSGRFKRVYYNYNQTPPVRNTWECPNCGSVNEETHNFCSRCGSPRN